MSKLVKDLVETILSELESHSPHASLDNVEEEVQQLVNLVRRQGCTHCHLNVNTASVTSQLGNYIKG